MAKYSKKAAKKVEKAMHEMKKGKLKAGKSGKKVTDPDQAIAIGLSEAKEAGAKVPDKKATGKKKKEATGKTSKAGKKTDKKKSKKDTRKDEKSGKKKEVKNKDKKGSKNKKSEKKAAGKSGKKSKKK